MIEPLDITWEDAVRHCREVARRHARNFYYGMRLAPGAKRDAMYGVYAWMRRADDLADDAIDLVAARAALEQYRIDTVRAFAGEAVAGDPAMVALTEIARRYPLDVEDFHGMIDGQLDDLDGRHYESFADLRGYCYRVAATVGLVCIRIWGYDDERAPQLAVDRGIAFQLTNIMRDVVEDHDRGRMYLPAQELVEAGLDGDRLVRWEESDRCASFVRDQLHRALHYYTRSEPLDAMVDRACRPTLWAMTEIYRRLAVKMREDPESIVRGRRVRLQAPHKVAIAIQARWRAHAGAGRA